MLYPRADLESAVPNQLLYQQEPGVYVMQSAVEAKNALRKRKVPGVYVVQAQMTAPAIAGTAELNGAFNNETRAVCTQNEPGVYVVQAKMPTRALVVELNEEFNNVADSSQREENAQHYQEKSRNKRAKKQCTKLACG